MTGIMELCSSPLPVFKRLIFTSALAVLLLGAACQGGGEAEPGSRRLVDGFDPAQVSGTVAGAAHEEVPPPWRFDGEAAGAGLEALGFRQRSGVEAVEIRDGLLQGKTTSPWAALHIERKAGLEDPDTIYAIEVRLKASQGQNVRVSFSSFPQLDLAAFIDVIRREPIQTLSSPLVPGDEQRTYTFLPKTNLQSKSVHHLVVWPSDEAGADFAIESVRLVYRREHLAAIPSGVSWQGLAGIYKEVLVARTPEVLRVPVEIPQDAWLDLSVGTVESDSPLTFEVAVETAGEIHPLSARTLTTAYRWDDASASLERFAGRKVDLVLSLSSPGGTGKVGFWGTPVVRQRQRHVTGEKPRGVILILADTLRRDHLDVYGYHRETAPEIRRLAEEGVRFEDCQSQASWTKPSVYSIVTSLVPTSHGVLEVMDRLPQSAETLAEVYRQAGYATFGMTSIYYLSSAFNFHQGFEELHEIDSLTHQPTSKSAREYVDRLIPWLERHQEGPFFVVLHVFDPHEPYKPYAPYDTMWADATKEQAQYDDFFKIMGKVEDPVRRMLGWPTRQEIEAAGVDPDGYIQFFRDWYDGSIRGMDAEIGRLMTYVRNSPLADSTLVAFGSDHGEEFLEHDRVSHGHAVYGEQTNVPLILWQPGRLPHGAVVGETVRNLDILPTLLAASGMPQPAAAQGHSLLPMIEAFATTGTDPERHLPSMAEKNALKGPLGPLPRDLESRALVDEGWKLFRHAQPPNAEPYFELFDHRQDPLDSQNLAAEHPDIVQRLRAELEGWVAKAQREALAADDQAAAEMDSEQLKKLRSLGYLP
jgi:arylsulfatase A-like enzyme